jgi:branched-chain amino acid aminotransferase
MEYFNYNGKFYANGSAIIGENNRGLRFGDGLFETMRSVDGRVDLIDEHFARLWKGMELFTVQFTKTVYTGCFGEQVMTLLKKNGHDKIARIRLTVFRGDGGLHDEIDHKPNWLYRHGHCLMTAAHGTATVW